MNSKLREILELVDKDIKILIIIPYIQKVRDMEDVKIK